MKQTEAADVIYSLLPQMKSAAPEEVMEKYARARGLAPAQLEKLGHVFNTASTLATLEHDRDAAPALVDVPQMVSHYIDQTGRSKRASFFGEDQVKVASAESERPTDLPNVWGTAPETLSDIRLQKQSRNTIPDCRRVFQQALDLAERAVEEEVEATSKFAAAIDKVARQLAGDEDPYAKTATLLADVEGLTSEIESDIVRSKLATALSGFGLDIQSNSRTAKTVVLSRDRTGFFPAVLDGLRQLKVAVEARASLTQTLELAGQMAAHLENDWDAAAQATKQASRIALLAEVGGILKEAAPDDKKKDRSTSYADRLETMLGATDKDTGEYKHEISAMAPYALGAMGQGAANVGREATSILKNDLPTYLKAFSLQGPAGQLLESTAEGNRTAANSMGINRRQIERDAISGALLKKLMLTDDVLAARDPELVFQVYQSIRRASPEVSTDESMLKLLLRLGTETGGLDIDTASAVRKFQYGNNPPQSY